MTTPPTWPEVRSSTLRARPELDAGRAEVSRSQAETAEMESMYWPMGMLRTGPAYTMTDGWGWMLTLGISIPLQRGRLDAGVREAEAMTAMARADLAADDPYGRRGGSDGTESGAGRPGARDNAQRRRPATRSTGDRPLGVGLCSGTTSLVSVLDTAQALWSIEAELVGAEV